MPLPSEITAQITGPAPQACWFVDMDLINGPLRLWQGHRIERFGGLEYIGLGELGQVSNVTQPSLDAAPEVTLTLSMQALVVRTEAREQIDIGLYWSVVEQASFVKGRRASIGLLIWDQNGAFLQRFVLYTGRMMTVRSRLETTNDWEDGNVRQFNSLSVTVESLTAGTRIRPRNSYYTPADQERRFTGDKGLDQAPLAGDKSVNWPRF